MKKAIIIVAMIFICGLYIFSVRTKMKDINKEKQIVKIDEIFEQKKEILKKTYPQETKELLEINNILIKMQYSKEMTPELVPLAVETTRLMYASDLLALNEKEVQEKLFLKDVALNVERKVYVMGSKIEDSLYDAQNAITTTTVIYYTTRGDIKREYKLVQEQGKWKIYSWEDSILSESSDKVEEGNETN